MEIFISQATKSDVKEIDKLLTDLIQDERKYDKNINEKYVVKNFYNQFINKENSCIAVAKNETEEIIGYCFAFIENTGDVYKTKIVQLDAIYVKPKFRKNKVGQKLIDYIINWAKSKNANFIELKVCNKNFDAIKLYEKCNFEVSKKIMLMELKNGEKNENNYLFN